MRPLTGTSAQVTETMKNFGISKSSIPEDLGQKIIVPNFDQKIINAITHFNYELPSSLKNDLRNTALKTTTEIMATRIINDIPSDEWDKL